MSPVSIPIELYYIMHRLYFYPTNLTKELVHNDCSIHTQCYDVILIVCYSNFERKNMDCGK